AEWWQEVSYGDVTMSGNAYGWFSLPWPSSPAGFDGKTDFGSTGVAPHVELTGDSNMEFGEGESTDYFTSKFKYDFDGVGEDQFLGNFKEVDWGFYPQFDKYGFPLYQPGERFMDINGNGIYDAGVYEFGIDKNHDGRIDRGKKAGSFGELVAANII